MVHLVRAVTALLIHGAAAAAVAGTAVAVLHYRAAAAVQVMLTNPH